MKLHKNFANTNKSYCSELTINQFLPKDTNFTAMFNLTNLAFIENNVRFILISKIVRITIIIICSFFSSIKNYCNNLNVSANI